MAKAERYQRIEDSLAVQYNPGDEEAISVIRGWANLPIDADLSGIEPGTWAVKRVSTGEIHLIPNDNFVAEFAKVLTVE